MLNVNKTDGLQPSGCNGSLVLLSFQTCVAARFYVTIKWTASSSSIDSIGCPNSALTNGLFPFVNGLNCNLGISYIISFVLNYYIYHVGHIAVADLPVCMSVTIKKNMVNVLI